MTCSKTVHFYLFKHLLVTSLGIQLPQVSCLVISEDDTPDLLHRIYFVEAWIAEKTETGYAKYRVEDIDHVTWSVGKTSTFRILASSQFSIQNGGKKTPESPGSAE